MTIRFDTIEPRMVRPISSALTRHIMPYLKRSLHQRRRQSHWKKNLRHNSELFTLCWAVPKQKIKRTNIFASIWKRATSPNLSVSDPTQNGWVEDEGMYQIRWYEGDMVPHRVWGVLDATDKATQQTEEDDIDIAQISNYVELIYGLDEY